MILDSLVNGDIKLSKSEKWIALSVLIIQQRLSVNL